MRLYPNSFAQTYTQCPMLDWFFLKRNNVEFHFLNKMANWHYCTWAKDSNTIRTLFIDLLLLLLDGLSWSTSKHSETWWCTTTRDVSSTATKEEKKKNQKQWIKTLIWVSRQIRQPAEMRVEHLHCAIMYSKWLHKCFFLSLKKKKKHFQKKVFIVEASLKVSLCYPFRGGDVNPEQWDSDSFEQVGEKSFRT